MSKKKGIYDEGDLHFNFSRAQHSEKFDFRSANERPPRWKAVDFIIKDDAKCFFVEVKDPDHPNATEEQRKEFLNQVVTGELEAALVQKYHNTFLYTWAEGQQDKTPHYLVLLCLESLDNAQKLALQDNLCRALPIKSPITWKRKIATSCLVLSLNDWNLFFTNLHIKRISDR